jgi:hypothetical protein
MAPTPEATPEHDLEVHIPMLHKLDEARRRSAELRDAGIEVLIEYLQPEAENDKLPPPPIFGNWRRENSLIIRALLARIDSRRRISEFFRVRESSSPVFHKQVGHLTKSSIVRHENRAYA